MVIWISGLTASGKTALGRALFHAVLDERIENVIHLDGDELRKRTNWVSGHSLSDRFQILFKIVDLIRCEQVQNKIVIVSTVSHKKEMRDYARRNLDNFYEVYLKCDLSVCTTRDYKEYYSRAKNQKRENQDVYPGVTEPYEESDNPELVINTGSESLKQSEDKLKEFFLPLINSYSGKNTREKQM